MKFVCTLKRSTGLRLSSLENVERCLESENAVYYPSRPIPLISSHTSLWMLRRFSHTLKARWKCGAYGVKVYIILVL